MNKNVKLALTICVCFPPFYFSGCGGNLQDPSGVITSPRYPSALPHYRECFWKITAPPGRRVKVVIEEINLPMDENLNTCSSYVAVSFIIIVFFYFFTFYLFSRHYWNKLKPLSWHSALEKVFIKMFYSEEIFFNFSKLHKIQKEKLSFRAQLPDA